MICVSCGVFLYEAPVLLARCRCVCYVLLLDGETRDGGCNARGPNAAAGDDKVIAGTHASYGFYYILFIIGDNLDSLQFDAEREAELG